MIEEREKGTLAPYAVLSCRNRGRRYEEEPCDIRTAFMRDRDRIIHCKSFRRLKHKTQVFIAPEGDHYRTRLTHTLEVSQIARTIARALRLNEDLTEAIALGHDLGHTPFGHAGEQALNSLFPGGFRHNEQSLRVVDELEHDNDQFCGLNLTFEVRDGILHHTGEQLPETLEGRIVRLADRIAYINHDIDDALRANLLLGSDLPAEPVRLLGATGAQRIDSLVRDIVTSSAGRPEILQSEAVSIAMDQLRRFMFSHVYIGSAAKVEEAKVCHLLGVLYQHYLSNPSELSSDTCVAGDTLERLACDYIAGMTDRYAMSVFARHMLPKAWSIDDAGRC